MPSSAAEVIKLDKMYIRNLKIFANHGVMPEEKRLGQLFVLSMELDLDLKKAGRSREISDTVHYGELCEAVSREFVRETYDLIETAALNIAEFILREYPLIRGVKVFLQKPWAPVKMQLDTIEIMVERRWHRAYIGLGSNMGDKEENLKHAMRRLEEKGHTKILKCSSFMETEPWGYADQDKFLNAVIEADTFLEPEELMDMLMVIETKLGRKREIKWGPRTMDLDVLLYDDLISNEEKIILPHPLMQDREFVLKPLKEIAPYLIHPVLHKSITVLLENIPVSTYNDIS